VRTVVVAPRATAPVHSLIRAAVTGTTVDGEDGWERGLTYAPETPGGYRAWMRCSNETVDERVTRTPTVDYEPYEVQFVHPCASTFGYNRQQREDELRRAVDATESFAIARELWTGELSQAAAAAGDLVDPNLSLTDGPTILNGGTPVKVHRALGMIEQAVGEALRGQQAYVHLARETLALFGYLQSSGNLLTSYSGNLLVADAGYPGSAPAGEVPADGVSWIYGTGQVVVRRSSLFMAGPDDEVIDTATNTIYLHGSKVVAATFDRSAHFAVPVDLTA
jgi:hypothetical protein